MPVHGDRPPGTAGGSGGGSARFGSLYDAHRAIRARWAVTLAEHSDGTPPDPDAVAFYRRLVSSADGSPDLTSGSASPDPPILESADGGIRWRLIGVSQAARGGEVRLDFGAPHSARQLRAQGALALGTTFGAVAGVSVAGDRLTTLTIRTPNAGDTGFSDRTVTAAALRALNAASVGDMPDNGNSIDLGVFSSSNRLFAGRAAGGGLLLAALAAAAPSVGVTSDDGPPAGEPAALPVDVDWRLDLGAGPLILRSSAAARTHTPRAVAGGRTTEGVRSLSWSGTPADTLAAGTVTLDALDPELDRTRLPPPIAAADVGRILRAAAGATSSSPPPRASGCTSGPPRRRRPRTACCGSTPATRTTPSSAPGRAVRGTPSTITRSMPAPPCRATRTSATRGS